MDVRETDTYGPALEDARGLVGPLGGLVNSAGVVDSTPMSELTVEAWQRILETNLTAYGFLLSEDASFITGATITVDGGVTTNDAMVALT